MESELGFVGDLVTKVISVKTEKPTMSANVRNWMRLWPFFWREQVAKALEIPSYWGKLYVKYVKADGTVVNYGLVSNRVVTDQFVEALTDDLQGATTLINNYKYHACGEDGRAGATSDVWVYTPAGTTDGTQIEGASANIYKSVATISFTTTKAVCEHVIGAATTQSSMDRHNFSTINVSNGDSIEFTYQLTNTAGG